MTFAFDFFPRQSAIRCLWHPKLNQIMVGTGNGLAKVYYDPVKSHRYVSALLAVIACIVFVFFQFVFCLIALADRRQLGQVTEEVFFFFFFFACLFAEVDLTSPASVAVNSSRSNTH